MERRGTLLVIEDEPLLRTLMAQFLRSEGYEVTEAADGMEGVERYRACGPFDLVTLDLSLPGFDGVEVCRQIKSVTPGQRVLICSASILPSHESALSSMGVHHYLVKPFPPGALCSHIELELTPSA